MNGEISLEEKLELDQWVGAAEQNRAFFSELTDPAIIKSSVGKMDQYDRSRVWEKFQLGIQQLKEKPDINKPPHLMTRKWLRYAAAAAVFTGVSIGAYFLMHQRMAYPREIAAKPIKTDIAPGGNRAILTLGNGSEIILDSAQNGIIAQQGNTNIVKTDSGKLTYKISPDIKSALSNNTMTTPRGGQYQLILSDGTKVWLNAASSITYPTAFVGSQRKVMITGEAYFEVAHNSLKPFLVSVNHMEVEVLGTHFNINAYPDETSITTTLLEGSVKVSWNNQEKLLKPGQQSQAAINGISIMEKADLDYVMAWKNGEMELANGDVKKLFREISRWYDVDIEYRGVIPEGQFAASIKRNLPLSNLLRVLDTYGVHTQLENKTIVVQ